MKGRDQTAVRVATGTVAGRLVFLAYLAAAGATVAIVALAHLRSDPSILANATRESGAFENATVLALMLLGLWCMTAGRRRRDEKPWRWGLPLFGLFAVMAGLEEMSWGQHVIGFSTPDFLAGRNIQNESNLHNLIDSEIFGALVHVPVYVFFVFPALLVRVAPALADRWPLSLVPAWAYPREHTVLVFCFGAGLHPWNDPVTIPDSVALVTALFLFALVMWRSSRRMEPWASTHFAAVILATALFAGSGAFFGYINLQYEIRELIVVLGFSSWLFNLPASASGQAGAR